MKKILIGILGIAIVLSIGFSSLAPVANAGHSFTLAVREIGSGTGTVTSSPGGINCPANCSANFGNKSKVTLTATGTSGSAFSGWSGCDTTNGSACTVTMNGNKTITATFQSLSHSLTVQFNGTGMGYVWSNPVGINCSSNCSSSFQGNTMVALNEIAIPTSTGIFGGWTGCDAVSSTVCYVLMSTDRTVTATFN
jgi:serine protease